MRGYNRAIIAGNLTRDPDVRYTVNKRAYARFGVAVNTRWKNQNGELQESTEFINVVVWGPMAENCGKYLKKGNPVLLEGRIQTTSYDARDGSGKRYSTEVVADSLQFIGSGQQNQQNPGSNSQKPQQQQNKNYNQPSSFQPPSDEAFGKPIGENGFGDSSFEGFSPEFLPPDGPIDESDIPF